MRCPLSLPVDLHDHFRERCGNTGISRILKGPSERAGVAQLCAIEIAGDGREDVIVIAHGLARVHGAGVLITGHAGGAHETRQLIYDWSAVRPIVGVEQDVEGVRSGRVGAEHHPQHGVQAAVRFNRGRASPTRVLCKVYAGYLSTMTLNETW